MCQQLRQVSEIWREIIFKNLHSQSILFFFFSFVIYFFHSIYLYGQESPVSYGSFLIIFSQVQLALDNVLCQSSVRNDVTMRIVRQQDKMRELNRHANYLESQLSDTMVELRQAQVKHCTLLIFFLSLS